MKQTGKIIQSLSGFYDVQTADHQIIRTRARGNFRKRKIKPIVGDVVDFENEYLLKIYPRKNQLVRPLIANVDQALVVMSSIQPAFSFNLLDRFLVILQAQQVQPLIYVSKTDLITPTRADSLQASLKYYETWGYPVFWGAAAQTRLLEALAQQETVLAGQTGVGKSTLLNQLVPALNLKTNAISQSLNRGKHTTRRVTLYPLQSGLIADTPGFSSLDWQKVTAGQLASLYPDLHYYSKQCKYRGCLHLQEPHCGVKAAVNAGQILTQRYQNYCQFQQELSQQRPVYQKTKK